MFRFDLKNSFSRYPSRIIAVLGISLVCSFHALTVLSLTPRASARPRQVSFASSTSIRFISSLEFFIRESIAVLCAGRQ